MACVVRSVRLVEGKREARPRLSLEELRRDTAFYRQPQWRGTLVIALVRPCVKHRSCYRLAARASKKSRKFLPARNMSRSSVPAKKTSSTVWPVRLADSRW